MPRRATRSENYEHTVAGLLTKRQELMDRALQLREQMAAISNDIESVETVLRAFGHDGDFKGMSARSGRVVYFHRNELRRFCIDELRKATSPVTSRELAEKIARLEGKDPRDRKLMNDMVKRVGKSLKLLRQQRLSASQRLQGVMVWRLANSQSDV